MATEKAQLSLFNNEGLSLSSKIMVGGASIMSTIIVVCLIVMLIVIYRNVGIKRFLDIFLLRDPQTGAMFSVYNSVFRDNSMYYKNKEMMVGKYQEDIDKYMNKKEDYEGDMNDRGIKAYYDKEHNIDNTVVKKDMNYLINHNE
jgi:hypothetical protein